VDLGIRRSARAKSVRGDWREASMIAQYRATTHGPISLQRVVTCSICDRKSREPIAQVILNGAQLCQYCGSRHVLTPSEVAEALLVLGIGDDRFAAPLRPL
jgi:hypothetical protein